MTSQLEMLDVLGRGLVDARQHHRQHLAHVTDDDLELRMLVEACRLSALENLVDECRRLPVDGGDVRAIGHQGSGLGSFGVRHEQRQAVTERELGEHGHAAGSAEPSSPARRFLPPRQTSPRKGSAPWLSKILSSKFRVRAGEPSMDARNGL